MENYNKKSYQLIYFLIINLFLASCSTTSGLLKPYQKNNIDIADNFSIEGKFKLSMPDSKETGYFFLKKTRNLIQINIGKNYLLPEEELLLDIREDLDIKKLISKTNQKKLYLDFNTINVGDFIKIIVGHEVDLSSYNDLEVFRDFNEREKALPTKVRLITSNYELTILNKKIYE
jgi:hypothetical protein|tara:strand:+ start:2336 stop:2860 length:525 start_codon:yes stop_codon:yes gene_type:complete